MSTNGRYRYINTRLVAGGISLPMYHDNQTGETVVTQIVVRDGKILESVDHRFEFRSKAAAWRQGVRPW